MTSEQEALIQKAKTSLAAARLLAEQIARAEEFIKLAEQMIGQTK